MNTAAVPVEKLLKLQRGAIVVIAYRGDENDLRKVQVRHNNRKKSLIVWDDPGITTTWGDAPYDRIREITRAG